MWANKKNNTGFTIVETLIVLAVSGALFVSVATLVAGQVGRNQASQAANSIEIYARDVLNDVATGYYPEIGQNFTCTNTGGTAPSIGLGGAARGNNPVCAFAGKRIVFKADQMEIDTMVAFASRNTITNVNQLAAVDTPTATLREVVNYPFSATRTGGDKTYYVLNRLISPSAAQETVFTGSLQGVNVVNTANASSAGGFKLCFDNGSETTGMLLGAKNGTNVEIVRRDTVCAES
jgi:type II secretory pathway pseudopilin PulG